MKDFFSEVEMALMQIMDELENKETFTTMEEIYTLIEEDAN